MTIRAAAATDIPAIIGIEHECPSAAHWTEQQYRELFAISGVRRLALVAEGPQDGGTKSIVGFLVARHLAPEWELENIVVAPNAQRMGVGTRLLESLLAMARATHSEAVFLEVRESNLAARGLYAKLGFRESGRRKSYYMSPLEDAVLYSFSVR